MKVNLLPKHELMCLELMSSNVDIKNVLHLKNDLLCKIVFKIMWNQILYIYVTNILYCIHFILYFTLFIQRNLNAKSFQDTHHCIQHQQECHSLSFHSSLHFLYQHQWPMWTIPGWLENWAQNNCLLKPLYCQTWKYLHRN